jgi:hypothetical protein
MSTSSRDRRYIIIRYEKGAWWGYVYVPGWRIITAPQRTEIDALIASFVAIQGEPGGSNID